MENKKTKEDAIEDQEESKSFFELRLGGRWNISEINQDNLLGWKWILFHLSSDRRNLATPDLTPDGLRSSSDEATRERQLLANS